MYDKNDYPKLYYYQRNIFNIRKMNSNFTHSQIKSSTFTSLSATKLFCTSSPCNCLCAAARSFTTCNAVSKKNNPPSTSTKQVENNAYWRLRNSVSGLVPELSRDNRVNEDPTTAAVPSLLLKNSESWKKVSFYF